MGWNGRLRVAANRSPRQQPARAGREVEVRALHGEHLGVRHRGPQVRGDLLRAGEVPADQFEQFGRADRERLGALGPEPHLAVGVPVGLQRAAGPRPEGNLASGQLHPAPRTVGLGARAETGQVLLHEGVDEVAQHQSGRFGGHQYRSNQVPTPRSRARS